jgi:CHAT domain-containing protein
MTETRKRWWIAAALAPALIAFGVIGQRTCYRSPIDRLQNAARSQPFRPIEARLSLLPEHRPLERRRGVDAALVPAPLRAAAIEVLEDDRAEQRLRASALLVVGDSQSALEVLQSVEMPDAATLSDLSATLLTESGRTDRLELATDALAAADKALQLEPGLAAGSFNRALALQRLGIFDEARAEWLRYAQLDATSPWSVEARAAANTLEPQTDADAWKRAQNDLRTAVASEDEEKLRTLVARFPQLSRVYAEGVYLGEWADGNRSSLDVARAVGAALKKQNGESLLFDAVAAIDRDLRRDPAHSATLAEAHRLYRDGRLAFRDQRLDEADRKLGSAEQAFSRGDSPMAMLARYYRGSVLYEQDRIREAEQLLDALAAAVAEQPTYRALAAQIGWERGACKMANGSLDRAREIFTESREILELSGEVELRAVFDIYLAQVNEYLGDADDAWRHRRRAFETLSLTGNESRVLVALAAAASSRIRREEWSRGAALSGVAMAMAERLKHHQLAAQCRIMSSVAASGEGRREAALDNLRHAERWIGGIVDPQNRSRLEAELGIAKAVAIRTTSPDVAITYVDRSIEFFEHAGHRLFLARAYLERARVYRAAGKADFATRDIEKGIDIAERQRESVSDFEERATFFAATKALFLEGTDLASSSGDIAAAFNMTERSRARAIVDAFSTETGVAQPMEATEIQRLLASDAAVISYVFFPTRVAIYVIRAGSISETSSPFTRTSARTAIDAWHSAVDRRDPPAILAARKQLHTILLSPIEPHLRGVSTAAVTSDPSIGTIPFGILGTAVSSGDRGRSLAIVTAPSATVAIACSRRRPEAQGDPLIVGASVFDRRSSGASELQSILAEIHAVAREWPASRRLMAQGATRLAFTEMARDARFIHFAGHAVDRLRSPADAHLMLAPSATDRGRMTAAEIASLDLRRTELVVLNACRAASSSQKPDGFLNLATAFLLAGVPAVIAAANDVDDSTAVEFSTRLHAHLRRGESPEVALQNVIQEIDAGEIGPATAAYAGFTVIGGSRALVRDENFNERGRKR